MIQGLLNRIIDLLVETLATEIPNAQQHVKAHVARPPAQTALPLIALGLGNFAIGTQPGETLSTEPRPDDTQQRFAVSPQSPQGPYLLLKPPLPGSLRCRLSLHEGSLLEQQIWLRENKDFTIDFNTRQLTVLANAPDADSLLVSYSFVSIFTLRELRQEFVIDIYAADPATVEKLGSLVAGSILIEQQTLLADFNNNAAFKAEYSAGNIGTLHRLHQIHLLTGMPRYQVAIPRLQLGFEATGLLKTTRAITDGFGLIERVHSPGRVSDQPVDILIDVE